MPHVTTEASPAVPEHQLASLGSRYQAPPPRRGRRLRDHIMVLALAVLAPALGGGVAAAWVAVDSYRTAAEGRLRDTAHALALALDSEIDSVTTALVTLAESPDLRPSGDLAAFEVQARAVGRALGTGVLARGPAPGFPTFINTFVPPGGAIPPIPPEAQEILRDVAASGRPRTTDLYLSPSTGDPTTAVVMPLTSDGPMRLLTMTLPPGRLAHLLEAQRLEAGGVASLVDGHGRIVARSHDHDRYLGQSAPYRGGGRAPK